MLTRAAATAGQHGPTRIRVLFNGVDLLPARDQNNSMSCVSANTMCLVLDAKEFTKTLARSSRGLRHT